MSKEIEEDAVRTAVREGYTAIAKTGIYNSSGSGCSGGACCGPTDFDVNELVAKIGYQKEETSHLPETANMGLSCGNPTALASLRPGEVVLDLGSGGGFDAFIAGPKVGPSGRVIGVDMTPEMISKARKNNLVYRERSQLDNVEFRLGEIEHLPVADQSVDVVISNCVLNLSPNKSQVWHEIARVLKPGGRVAISDLALLKPLPAALKTTVESLVGCVAGAALVSEIKHDITQAGLKISELSESPDYTNAMLSFNDPLFATLKSEIPPNSTPADFIISLAITATKPT
jgi:arsenite methyltransferase